MRAFTVFGNLHEARGGAGEQPAPPQFTGVAGDVRADGMTMSSSTGLASFSVGNPLPAQDFNEAELKILDRLYKVAETAVTGPVKDFEALSIVAPNNTHIFGLTLEAFARNERDYWRKQSLDAELLFLKVKAEQLAAYLKDPNEKRRGKMFCFEELDQRMKLFRRDLIEQTVKEFLRQNAAQKKRWVKVPEGAAGAASTEERFTLSLVDFTSEDPSKLSMALRTEVEAFRRRLTEALSDELILVPEAYLLRSHLAMEDLRHAHEEPVAVTSVQKALRRHVISTLTLKVSLHYKNYEATLATHPAEVAAAMAAAEAEIERLASLLPAPGSEVDYTSLDVASLDTSRKGELFAVQEAQDAVLIQQTLHAVLVAHKELCSQITNDESLMPVQLLQDHGAVLCDPLTTSELRYRMLAPLMRLIEYERKKFKEYCELNMGMIPDEDEATGRVSWKPISDLAAFNRYLDRFCTELRKSFSVRLVEWMNWDIADPELVSLSTAQADALKQIIRKKLDTVLRQIQELEAASQKLQERIDRNARLRARVSHEEDHATRTKKERFRIMMGDQLAAYEAAYEAAKTAAPPPAHFYTRDAAGDEVIRPYADATLLARYHEGARAEKLVALVEHGIPSDSYYRARKGGNLLHLALSNKAEDYDSTLVLIVQYLLARGVDAWQLNKEGITPAALVRMLIEICPVRSASWLVQVREIDTLCAQAAVLMERRDEFASLRAELGGFIERARALIAAEDARALGYKATHPVVRILATPPVPLAPYEDAICLAQHSLFALFEILLAIPRQMPPGAARTEFARKFNALLEELAKRPPLQAAQRRLAELRSPYEKALAPQVLLARASVSADMDVLRRQIAASNAIATAATEEVTALRTRVDKLVQTLQRAGIPGIGPELAAKAEDAAEEATAAGGAPAPRR